MIDRQLIGDVVLAALIAIPTAVIAKPDVVTHRQTAAIASPDQNSAIALASAGERQVGLFR